MIFSHQVDGVSILVTHEKWYKKKILLKSLMCKMKEGKCMYFKSLESARYVLIYVSRTYQAMIPFLLDMHHTLDSWWPNRVEDGWPQNRLLMSMEGYGYEDAPVLDQAVVQPSVKARVMNRLCEDLRVLTMLTSKSLLLGGCGVLHRTIYCIALEIPR
jgi:hypothetical protein